MYVYKKSDVKADLPTSDAGIGVRFAKGGTFKKLEGRGNFITFFPPQAQFRNGGEIG